MTFRDLLRNDKLAVRLGGSLCHWVALVHGMLSPVCCLLFFGDLGGELLIVGKGLRQASLRGNATIRAQSDDKVGQRFGNVDVVCLKRIKIAYFTKVDNDSQPRAQCDPS